MKSKKIIYALLLAIMAITGAKAQTIEDGEAFYIYRNDGDFDGFFYDQVQEIRCSKLDLDSVEHDEYVVQEVVTADSVYRIPLAAIDSVGFVQPEIKFASKVRHMDDLGMTQYLTSVDDMTLTFSNALPAAQMPHEGDVLLGFTGILEENGFGGKVTNVSNSGSDIVVTCEQLTKMSDIFSRFVSVEQVGYDENINQVRRRMAGYHQVHRISEGGSYSRTLFNISTNLHIPFDTYGSVGTVLDAGVSFRMQLGMVYQINGDDFFFKATTSQDYSLNVGFTLKISADGSKTINLAGPLNAIKFPATCPLFEIRPLPELGVNWKGEISAVVSLPVRSGGMSQTFKIDSDDPDFVSYTSNSYSNSNGLSSIFSESDLEFKMLGSVQAGIVTTFGIQTNSWFSKIFSAQLGVDIWAGPKLEGSINVAREFFTEDDGPYVFRNSHIGYTPLSVDLEAYARTKFFAHSERKLVFAEGSFSPFPRDDMYIFPSIKNMQASLNEKTRVMSSSWETDKQQVFWPSQLGMRMYHKDAAYGIEVSDYAPALSFGGFSEERFNFNVNTRTMRPGTYYVAPVLKAFGEDYVIKSMKQEVKVPVYLEVPKKISAPAKGGPVSISASTNGNLNGTNKVELEPNNSYRKKEIAHGVVASADDNSMPPVTANVYIEQEGSQSNNIIDIRLETEMGMYSLGDYGFVTYGDDPESWYGDAPTCVVSPSGDRATVSGSYSHSKSGSSQYSQFVQSTGADDYGNWWWNSVSESVSWNFTFNIDRTGDINRTELEALTSSYPTATYDANDGTDNYSITPYYLAAAIEEEPTMESSGWNSNLQMVFNVMSAVKKVLWKYERIRNVSTGVTTYSVPKVMLTAPLIYQVLDGNFYSHVSASATGISLNRTISFTVKDGYIDGNYDTIGTGSASIHVNNSDYEQSSWDTTGTFWISF